MQKAALANYLRPLHATQTRYKSLIQQIKTASGRSDIFEINNQNFESELISICESHNLNATVLGEIISAHEDRFPRSMPIGGYEVNTQFIAALLRLSDILDFDYERTPKSLFESLGIKHSTLPGAEVSLFEWQKHLVVHTIEILKEEIVISGTCKHPIIEAGIREFCQIIEHEIHETNAILRRNSTEIQGKYVFILPSVVRANLRSEGYIFMNLSLKLDEAAVMTLLMGNRLYNSPLVAIRELIQNGVDACLVRSALVGDGLYKPTVSVSTEKNKIDNSYWLNIKDNGIGMDDHVLKNHFFRVGSSYYKTPEYKRLYKNSTVPIPTITSKFGIGFLSTFMLGNEVIIITKKTYPGGGQSRGKKIFVERMGALAFVQEDETIDDGTIVKVRLKNLDMNFEPELFESYINANVIRPMVPVEVNFGRFSNKINPSNYYSVNVLDKSEIYKNKLELIELKIPRTNGIEGKIIFIFFKNVKGEFSFKEDEKSIEITTSNFGLHKIKVNPSFLIPDFEGNRVTVGGFKMSFSNLGKLFRANRNRIAFIYDLDFAPGDEVDFNVSRTKILDENLKLRNSLRQVIIYELKKIGILEKLDDITRKLIGNASEHDVFGISVEELEKRLNNAKKNGFVQVNGEMLDKIESALPKDVWPMGIHRTIASELGISRSQAYTGISMLIISGRVANPNLRDTPTMGLPNR